MTIVTGQECVFGPSITDLHFRERERWLVEAPPHQTPIRMRFSVGMKSVDCRTKGEDRERKGASSWPFRTSVFTFNNHHPVNGAQRLLALYRLRERRPRGLVCHVRSVEFPRKTAGNGLLIITPHHPQKEVSLFRRPFVLPAPQLHNAQRWCLEIR